MEEFMKTLKKKYGIDEDQFKKIVILGIIAIIVLAVGGFILSDSMKVKTLSKEDLQAKTEKLWKTAQSKGATTEEQYRRYIMNNLKKVNTKQFYIDVTPEGVTVTSKLEDMNKYGFYYELPYEYRITEDEAVTKYCIVFHNDGSADLYTGGVDTGYVLMCDVEQTQKNLKVATRMITINDIESQFSQSGLVLTMGEHKPTVSFNDVHGIYREYDYVGILDNVQTTFRLSNSNKATLTNENETIEMQIRTDCGEHRLIHNGEIYAILSLDGRTLKIGNDTLKIKEVPYRLNNETLKYPGMKVKLVEGSTVELVKAGRPKTGDVIVYNDYMYVCNKHYDGKDWVVFNKDESNPEWGVKVADHQIRLLPNMESEIFNVPVTSLAYTYSGCSGLEYAPKLSTNAKMMIGTFNECLNLKDPPSIPSTVTNLAHAFRECRSLKVMPIIPERVTTLEGTFAYCKTLETATKIPESVYNLTLTFEACGMLSGTVKIDSATVTAYKDCFYGTGRAITLTGKCKEETLKLIAKTALDSNVRLETDPVEDDGDGFTEITE